MLGTRAYSYDEDNKPSEILANLMADMLQHNPNKRVRLDSQRFVDSMLETASAPRASSTGAISDTNAQLPRPPTSRSEPPDMDNEEEET